MNRNGRRGFDGPDARHRTRRTAFAYPGWAAPTTGAVAIAGGGGAAILGPLRGVPFAQGYKADTISGGRVIGAGEVRKVTNLNASGAGSLAAALSTPGPADVLFEVGGVIPMTDNVNQYDDTSVWFGTAPSPGITLQRAAGDTDTNRGCLYNMNGSNMVVSHLRIRDRNDLTNSNNQSNLFVGYQDPDHGHGTAGAHNVLLDHLSTAWGGDEHAFVVSPGTDITFWRCFMGPTAYAGRASLVCDSDVLPSEVYRLLYQQCFFALSFDRCPEAKGGTNWALYNSYLYACGHPVGVGSSCSTAFFGVMALGAGATTRLSCRGSVYEGNSNNNRPQLEFDGSLGTNSHQSYFNDSATIVRCVESPTVVTAVSNETDLTMGLPEVAIVVSSSTVKALVLANAGARINDRDFVDSDAITAANAGTGTPLTGAPPSLYTLGTSSLGFSVPGDWNAQAPDEVTGWRKLDVLIHQRHLLVGAL